MNYKENTKLLTLMQIPEWVEKINKLKNFKPENYKDYDCYVKYRKDNQRKERKELFEKIKYIKETNSFVFDDGKLVVKECDITNFEVKDKIDMLNYIEHLNKIK